MQTNDNTAPKKILVIGSGPGGYIAAIRAAQLGAQVTIIEKEEFGGTCLNVGCIPTKTLLHTAELYREMKESSKFGIDWDGNATINWKNVQKRKKIIIKKMTAGVRSLMQQQKIEIIKGMATFLNDNEVQVTNAEGSQILRPQGVIIATGSRALPLNIPGNQLPGVIDSTGALNMESLPKDMVVIGGGVVSVEFANLFQSLGVQVTLLSRQSRILSNIDEEISVAMAKNLQQLGMVIHFNSSTLEIQQTDTGLGVVYEQEGEQKTVYTEMVLSSAGRGAYKEGLGLENTSIIYDKKGIAVNEKMETNVPNIYAIGDVTGNQMLAHVASEEGIVAAENLMNEDVVMSYDKIPSCIYTLPEIAMVGIDEKTAKERGHTVSVGKFPLGGNGKSLILNQVTDTFVKVVFDVENDQLLGMMIYGPRATDMITEGTLGLVTKATFNDFYQTIHPHPTISESIKEAVLDTKKLAFHKLEL